MNPQTKTVSDQPRTRPRAITRAAALHLLIALAFISIPLVGLIYGADVQAAAQAEVVRQGQSPAALTSAGLRFDEQGLAIWAPAAIAGLVVAVGAMVHSGRRLGRILSWIVLPLVLIGNVLIMVSNATAAQALQQRFDTSADPALRALDAQALLDAAYSAYPGWLPALEWARLAAVVIGCVLAPVLLALRPARTHFRAPQNSPVPTRGEITV